MVKEIWKDIEGYKGRYQVGSLGSVKSLCRTVKTGTTKGSRIIKEAELKPSVSSNGYHKVTLYKNHKSKTISIHQLVAIAFLNHKVDGYNIVVDHIDNNKLNNYAVNLQLTSQRENSSKDRIGSSKYTGVHLIKKTKKWCATIKINGIKKHLGNFDNEYDAHLMYQSKLNAL